MGSAPESFVFQQVGSTEADEAFSFHRSIATSDSHIWPRTERQLQQLAYSGHLYGVRRANGEFVAICYCVFIEADSEWEIGGITVAESWKRHGIGIVLSRIALAHTLAMRNPLAEGQRIITMVHEANEAPRKLLRDIGFTFEKEIPVPDHIAPKSMKKNADGKLIGHKFLFTANGLRNICCWADDFDSRLRSGSHIRVHLGPVTMRHIGNALKAMAAEHTDCEVKCYPIEVHES